jgi:hypothetical protein
MKMQVEHRERIRTIPTMIDNKSPPVFKHLEFKPKKAQLQEGKFSFVITYFIKRGTL